MNQLDYLKKLATVMMQTEAFIQHNAAQYLPKSRSRMIDLGTIALSEFEDDFFTYDLLKNLVINMVSHHEAQHQKWFIDVDHCTSEHVAITQEPSGQSLVIPVSVFFAGTLQRAAMH